MSHEAVIQLRIMNTAARNRILEQSNDPLIRAKKLEQHMHVATRASLTMLFSTQDARPMAKAVRDSVDSIHIDAHLH